MITEDGWEIAWWSLSNKINEIALKLNFLLILDIFVCYKFYEHKIKKFYSRFFHEFYRFSRDSKWIFWHEGSSVNFKMFKNWFKIKI